MAAVAGGAAGVLLAMWLETVIGAITTFYSLLVVTLFVPILGGLYTRRAGELDALVAIIVGVTTPFALRVGLFGTPTWLDPTLCGIVRGCRGVFRDDGVSTQGIEHWALSIGH